MEIIEEQKLSDSDASNIEHINDVRRLLTVCIMEIHKRSTEHDASKLQSPEREVFGRYYSELIQTEYGTPEYEALLSKVQPAIDHHYAHNRHHPQFHKNGVNDMDLVDILEMLIDWIASSGRTKNGNIRKSLEVNKDRYKISDQLMTILENTVKHYF
jgi:hypothetical protein